MKNITLLFILFVSILNTSCSKNKPRATEHFSFHLLAEPKDLDPAHIRGSSGSYLFNNLYRGLYSYGNDKLKPENIESCRWLSELKLSCTLKNKQWSNGEKIKAQDYIRTFRRLFNKNTKTYQTEHLLNIKNAKKILAGTAFPINLEVSSSKSNQIIFELVKPDSNFLNILASPSFSPTYSKNNYETNQTTATVTNGPYKVKKWIKGSYAVLTPNKYYDKKWELRPEVKIYFLENDETALTLFETGKINFLRRLLTGHIQRYKDSPQLMTKSVLRFDYIGLTSKILPHLNLRKALAYSLNYPELQKVYSSKSLPGCPGLPKSFQKEVHCFSYDLKKAKVYLAKVPNEIKSKTWTLHYSKMGGKDIKKGMEWIQNQWSKNLGLNIRLQAAEQGMYLPTLRGDSIDLFRKGVGVDHPTCLSALKTFSRDSGENYIKFNNQNYENIISQMSNPNIADSHLKILCSQGIQQLINSHQWIPLGEIYFAMLNDNKFTGFTINNLNQLDLADLRKK